MRNTVLAFVVTCVALAPQEPAAEARAQAAEAEIYAALLDVGFDASGALEVANVEFSRGPATFVFESGTWVPFGPVSGTVSGGVFIGTGRVLYSPPSGVEQDQLEKFTDEQALEEEFERVYLRFTDATASSIAANLTTVLDESPTRTKVVVRAADLRLLDEVAKMHEEVTEHLLEEERFNVEARLFADIIDGQKGFFTAWIDTRDDGPLHFVQDPEALDLFTLRGWATRRRGFDKWGGFGAVQEPAVRPIHYSIDMTLDGDDLKEARADLDLVARRQTRVLRFDAHPLVEIQQVLDAAGEPLFFVRSEAEDDEFEGNLTVVLPEPLAVGVPTRLSFAYVGDIVDTLWGGGEYALKTPVGWYPSIGYLQRATYDLTFRVDKGDKIFASGERVSDEVVDDVRVARFEQTLPVMSASFNYGSMSTRVVDVEGAPPITVFGTGTVFGGDTLGNVGADVGNSLVMFAEMFGDYPFTYMSATRIPYSHGQGFPGLLHLAAESFGSERRGHTEAFRGHETAHQWWGHIVGWKSYRDQWISEGFVEYSGALYAEAYLNAPELLDEMTEAWRNDVFRRGNVGFRSFGMPPAMMQRLSDGSMSGPITLGYRLSSTETPADFAMLAYEKGAYILHMLRMAMYDWNTGSDEPWRVMMRDFVATHAGGEATTESFRGIVEKHFGDDMRWFFDQWVYGTAVPSYRYAWKVETAIDGQRMLRVRVRQSVVPDVPFRMFVPLRVELGDDRFVVLRVLVDEAYEEFSFNLPGGLTPEEVILNPRNAVLAEVDEENW